MIVAEILLKTPEYKGVIKNHIKLARESPGKIISTNFPNLKEWTIHSKVKPNTEIVKHCYQKGTLIFRSLADLNRHINNLPPPDKKSKKVENNTKLTQLRLQMNNTEQNKALTLLQKVSRPRHLQFENLEFNVNEILGRLNKPNNLVLISSFTKAKRFICKTEAIEALHDSGKYFDVETKTLYFRLKNISKSKEFYKNFIAYLNENKLYQFSMVYDKQLPKVPKKSDENTWRKVLLGRVENHVLISKKTKGVPKHFQIIY